MSYSNRTPTSRAAILGFTQPSSLGPTQIIIGTDSNTFSKPEKLT